MNHIAMGRKFAEEVVSAKAQWQRAKFDYEKAAMEYEYARKRLVLARDRFILELNSLTDDQAMDIEQDTRDLDADFAAIRYVGVPIGEAVKRILRAEKTATTEEIVDFLRRGGFDFTAEVPAREVHAALMKQAWAVRNTDEGRWEYLDQ